MIKRSSAALAAATLLLAVAGCSGASSKGSGSASAPTDPSKVTGDITVLTHKTDLAGDGTLDRYAVEFNKIYPNVHVKFEAIVAYETDVKVRMNSDNYGDVLMIPAAIPLADYPKFFAPLGTTSELSQKYRFMENTSLQRAGLRHPDQRQRQRPRLQQGGLAAGRVSPSGRPPTTSSWPTCRRSRTRPRQRRSTRSTTKAGR